MPYAWTEPELYLEHPSGVKVWNTYKGMRDYPMSSCFTTKECDDDCESGSSYVFDVYDLPEAPDDLLQVALRAAVAADAAVTREDVEISVRIVNAINEGLLELPEENQPVARVEIPEFEWPVCPHCRKEITVSRHRDGTSTAYCPECNQRHGYAEAETHRGALVKYINRDVVD